MAIKIKPKKKSEQDLEFILGEGNVTEALPTVSPDQDDVLDVVVYSKLNLRYSVSLAIIEYLNNLSGVDPVSGKAYVKKDDLINLRGDLIETYKDLVPMLNEAIEAMVHEAEQNGENSPKYINKLIRGSSKKRTKFLQGWQRYESQRDSPDDSVSKLLGQAIALHTLLDIDYSGKSELKKAFVASGEENFYRDHTNAIEYLREIVQFTGGKCKSDKEDYILTSRLNSARSASYSKDPTRLDLVKHGLKRRKVQSAAAIAAAVYLAGGREYLIDLVLSLFPEKLGQDAKNIKNAVLPPARHLDDHTDELESSTQTPEMQTVYRISPELGERLDNLIEQARQISEDYESLSHRLGEAYILGEDALVRTSNRLEQIVEAVAQLTARITGLEREYQRLHEAILDHSLITAYEGIINDLTGTFSAEQKEVARVALEAHRNAIERRHEINNEDLPEARSDLRTEEGREPSARNSYNEAVEYSKSQMEHLRDVLDGIKTTYAYQHDAALGLDLCIQAINGHIENFENETPERQREILQQIHDSVDQEHLESYLQSQGDNGKDLVDRIDALKTNIENIDENHAQSFIDIYLELTRIREEYGNLTTADGVPLSQQMEGLEDGITESQVPVQPTPNDLRDRLRETDQGLEEGFDNLRNDPNITEHVAVPDNRPSDPYTFRPYAASIVDIITLLIWSYIQLKYRDGPSYIPKSTIGKIVTAPTVPFFAAGTLAKDMISGVYNVGRGHKHLYRQQHR